jgi:hypothetical protein
MNHDQHDPYDPHDPLTEPEAADPHLDPTQGDHSRRTMVRTLLGAAAGAAVASVAAVATDHRHAQAATGTMIYGATNNSGLDTTVLRANVAGGRTLSVINFEPNGYAVAGEADTVYGGYGNFYGIDMTAGGTGARLRGNFVGVIALAQNSGGGESIGVQAVADTYGVVASADRAQLMLVKEATMSPGQHYSGEMIAVGTGADAELWFVVTDGNPGVARKIAGPGTAGSLHPVDPFRVYDSRLDPAFANSRLASGESRLISVADARRLDTGAVTTAGAVPDGATAIAYNLTVVDTVGAGFLAVTPGGATSYGASAINWSATGQALANGQLVKLDESRRVQVFAGGGGSAHVVIDVQGYYR